MQKVCEYKDLEQIFQDLGITLTGNKYDKAQNYLQENCSCSTAEWISKGMLTNEPDYSREFGMACWCDEAEQCENEDHT
jgi:hypothetical protein